MLSSARSSLCLPGELLRAWRPRPRSRNKSRGLTGSWALSLLILAAGAYVTQMFLAASHVAVMVLGVAAYLGFRALNEGLEGYAFPRACGLKEKDGCTNLIVGEMPKASCRPQPRDTSKESPKDEVKQCGRGAGVVSATSKAHHPRGTAKKIGRKVRRSAEQHGAAVEQQSAATGVATQQEAPSGAESTTASEKEDAAGAMECSKTEPSITAKPAVSAAEVPSGAPSVPATKKVDAAAPSGSLKKERTTASKQAAVAEVPSDASSTTASEKEDATETPEPVKQSTAITRKQEASAEVTSGSAPVPDTKKVDAVAASESMTKEQTTISKQVAKAEVPSGSSSTAASQKEAAAETPDSLKQSTTVARKQEAAAEVPSGAPSVPATKKVDAVAPSDSLKKERTTASKQAAVAEVPIEASSTTASKKEDAAEIPDSSKECMTPPAQSAPTPKEEEKEEPEVDWDKVVESIILREASSGRHKSRSPPRPEDRVASLPPPPEGVPPAPVMITVPLEEVPPTPVMITVPPEEVPAAPVMITVPPEEVPAALVMITVPPEEVPAAPVMIAMPPEEVPAAPVMIAMPPEEVPPAPLVITAVDASTTEQVGKDNMSACVMDAIVPASIEKLDPGPDLPPGLAIPPRVAAFVGPALLVPGSEPPAPPGLPPPPLLMAKPAVAGAELAHASENAVGQEEEGGDSESSASVLPHVGRVLQAAANGQLYVEKVEQAFQVEGDHPLLKSSGRGLMADAAPFEPTAGPQEETWDALEGQEWQQMEVAAMWQQWWAAAAAGYDAPGVQLCEGLDAGACSFPAAAGFPACHPAMEDPSMCDPDTSYAGMCDPAMWGEAYECTNEYWNCQAPCAEEEHLSF